MKYDKNFGNDRICKCDHPYHRHFDSYENMSPVGCKYCGCYEFEEKKDKKTDYKRLLKKAISLATLAHEGQKRWTGEPYITHPKAVAGRFQDTRLKIISWLHDTIEDTSVTAKLLSANGFTRDIIDAVVSVSRKDDETYLDFILRVKESKLGRLVKQADIEHNLSCDVGKIGKDKMSKSMRDKYYLARYILEMD